MVGGPILLVEDSPDDEFLAVRALRRQGMGQVVVARDGEEALARLFGTGVEGGSALSPWFILLDLKLPKLNGIDVLQALRDEDHTRLIPVIIMSSSREEADVCRCRALGVLDYLAKPVDGREIVEVLTKAGLMKEAPLTG
ncbi:MAG: response regulator [Desulfuromonadales bacterium]|nr:MAG: response regulator [Desulfuromonadales bacterium]